MINGKLGQGTQSPKMGADSSAKNALKIFSPKFSTQTVCPSPKVWDFRKKAPFGCLQSVTKFTSFFVHYIFFQGEFDEEGDPDEPMIMQPIEDFEEEIVGDDDDYETGNGNYKYIT